MKKWNFNCRDTGCILMNAIEEVFEVNLGGVGV